MKDEQLTEKIIGCAYKVHGSLGPGFLEKVYENALIIELNELAMDIERQVPLVVYYQNQVVGEYCADLLIENKVLIELKAVQKLGKEHEVQLVNYLTATKIDIGLLINFGGVSVEVKRRLRRI